MYKCQKCQQSVPSKTKANRVVVETRKRVYPGKEETKLVKGVPTRIKEPDTVGFEIVREIVICPECVELFA